MNGNGSRLLALQFAFRGQPEQRPAGLRAIAELFCGPFPTQLPSRRQLAQIEHAPLHDSPARAPAVLNQAPVRIGLSVFAPFMASQEDRHQRGFYQLRMPMEETRSALQAVLDSDSLIFPGNRKTLRRKFLKTGSSCES
jgi:hypothetical protein